MQQEERRRSQDRAMDDVKKSLNEINISIAILTNRLESLHTSKNIAHEQIYTAIREHQDLLFGKDQQDGLKTKVKSLEDLKPALVAHAKLDMALFGMIFTAQIAIITKLAGVW